MCPLFSCASGPLEHVHLSLPFVTTKNKEVNATAVLWPSQVGTLTYVWWYGNNTEVGRVGDSTRGVLGQLHAKWLKQEWNKTAYGTQECGAGVGWHPSLGASRLSVHQYSHQCVLRLAVLSVSLPVSASLSHHFTPHFLPL